VSAATAIVADAAAQDAAAQDASTQDAAAQDGGVAVVGHNGTIRILLCHLLGMPVANYRRKVEKKNRIEEKSIY